MMQKFWEVLEDSISDVRIAKKSKLESANRRQTNKKYCLILTAASYAFLH